MSQNEIHLAKFIEILKTTDGDVNSLRKEETVSYFLMLQSFFENYINENNE